MIQAKTEFGKNPYMPRAYSLEADICINHCPQPDKDCKGKLCEFYRKEKARRIKNGNKTE